MSTEIVITEDSSATLYSEIFNEHYHSIGGAINESMHIFINLGLHNFSNKEINILEVGYGTGLNAILTYKENQLLNNKIYYHGIDLYPISLDTFHKLAYFNLIKNIDINTINNLFCNNWNKTIMDSSSFSILKENINLLNFSTEIKYDLIYFDAFSPESQPELWTEDIFNHMFKILKPNGILVSYCSKGTFKRNLRNSGFIVNRHKGPGKKRHVIKALKK